MRAQATVALAGLVAAIVLAFYADGRGVSWVGILVLACVPIVILTVPAGLMLWATYRHGDPYRLPR